MNVSTNGHAAPPATPVRWPNLAALADAYLGRPYAEGECWRLVCEVCHAGGFLDAGTDPMRLVQQVTQIWWQDDPRDVLTLVQPWDIALLRNSGTAVEHCGLVVDPHTLLHVQAKAGVCLVPLRRKRQRLLQVARLRCLL